MESQANWLLPQKLSSGAKKIARVLEGEERRAAKSGNEVVQGEENSLV